MIGEVVETSASFEARSAPPPYPATKENTGQLAASQMQSWGNASAGLQRVREAAKRDKRLRFTALLHHVSVALLMNSFYALKRGAAPGVDGLTWQDYETDLDKRLEELHSRVHRGTYRALPSKRAYIPKPDGRQRPLGIAALEDKIVQHAVGTVLNQIYEEDFLGFSYGFRPGRRTHDALDALSVAIMRKKVNWVLDADIRDCFGSFTHEWMEKFLQHRIGDRRILRLIKKWLRAGVLEDGNGRRRRRGLRKVQRFHHCFATSTYTTPSIFGFSTGGSIGPRGKSSWSVMPTTVC